MNTTIRPSVADGILYYDDEVKLKNYVKSSIAANHINKTQTPRAIIAPSANYLLAGNVYGTAYSQLLNEQYDTVIVISQIHKMSFYAIGLTTSNAFESPVGIMDVDEEANRILKSYNEDFIIDAEEYHLTDPSIELQIPFLLEVLSPETKILPVIMGESNTKFTLLLSKALRHLHEKTGKKYLILIATNLSSDSEYEKAIVADKNCIEILRGHNPDYLSEQFALNQIKADGSGPLITLVRFNEDQGKGDIKPLKYCTSADVTEDKSRVEGYLAAVLF